MAPQVQPMDLTKTRMQLMPKGTSPIAVARDVIAQGGIKGLYAGCVLDVCLLRRRRMTKDVSRSLPGRATEIRPARANT